MADILVKNIMTTNVVSVHEDTILGEVARVLHEKHLTGVPVIRSDQTVVGVIMERDFITSDSKLYLPTFIQTLQQMDIYKKDRPKMSYALTQLLHAKAKDIVNPVVVVVHPEDNLETLSQIFATKRVNPVPVVNAHNQLLGIVSRIDLIKFFIPKLAESIIEQQAGERLIDRVALETNSSVFDNFSLVSKTRIFLWFNISLFFVTIGFILGILWMVNFG